MKRFSFILSLCLALGIGLYLIMGMANSANGQGYKCEFSVVQNHLVEYTPYYNACGNWLKTTFAYGVANGGYPNAHVVIDGAGFDRYYSYDGRGPGSIVETTYCPNKINHRIMIDIQPIIWNDPGFTNISLTAEYSSPNQQ